MIFVSDICITLDATHCVASCVQPFIDLLVSNKILANIVNKFLVFKKKLIFLNY